MKIQELAIEMGQPVEEVERFVSCLKVWTDKGFSLEQAIDKNFKVMASLMLAGSRLVQGQGTEADYAFKRQVGDAVWDQVNTTKGQLNAY